MGPNLNALRKQSSVIFFHLLHQTSFHLQANWVGVKRKHNYIKYKAKTFQLQFQSLNDTTSVSPG